jgi:AcrR family transcriptional regulator
MRRRTKHLIARDNARGRLLDAGRDVIRTHGFTAATIDDLRHGAGVTKGALFRYFSGKEVPVAAVAKHGAEASKAATSSPETVPDSAIGAVMPAPADTPSGPEGAVLAIEFAGLGRRFPGLNVGPVFAPNEAVSSRILAEDQAETALSSNAITGAVRGRSRPGACWR